MNLLTLSVALASLHLGAADVRMAAMPVAAGEGVTEGAAAALTDAIVAELRRLPGASVVTQQELQALISLEQQKQALGCGDGACLAEIGGALGVERLVTANVSKLGESWLVGLKLFDVKKARMLSNADRRIRGGTIDDVLDAFAPMVAELFGVAGAVPRTAAAATTAVSAPAAPAAAPPGWAEEPMELGEKLARLEFATDGKGRYVAWDPRAGSFEPFWAGDGQRFFAQRVVGGSRDGDTAWDLMFWDPRHRGGGRPSFGMRDGRFSLWCGRDKQLPYEKVAPGEAARLRKAKFFQPRWRRQAWALARDDEGTYYFVDRAREPEGNTDFRLFVGARGKLQFVPLKDVLTDGGGELYLTTAGKLKLGRADGKPTAEWLKGPSKTSLTHLPVEDHAQFAYTDLGVYAGESLGTACDGQL